MNGKDAIKKEMQTIMSEGEIAGAQIYRGFDYEGAFSATGWWLKKFGQSPVFLGKNVEESLSSIRAWKD